jgi:hypothetical protein
MRDESRPELLGLTRRRRVAPHSQSARKVCGSRVGNVVRLPNSVADVVVNRFISGFYCVRQLVAARAQ